MPETEQQAAAVVKYAHENNVPATHVRERFKYGRT